MFRCVENSTYEVDFMAIIDVSGTWVVGHYMYIYNYMYIVYWSLNLGTYTMFKVTFLKAKNTFYIYFL